MKTKKTYVAPDDGFILSSQPKDQQYHIVVKSLWSGAWLLGSIYDSSSTICVDFGKLLKLLVFQFTCMKNRYFSNSVYLLGKIK